jgi:hypothetical protein
MSRSAVLVDADWVQAHLDDPKVALVEVDENTTAYDKNHIRGAIRDSGVCPAIGVTHCDGFTSDGHCGRIWREGAYRDYAHRFTPPRRLSKTSAGHADPPLDDQRRR